MRRARPRAPAEQGGAIPCSAGGIPCSLEIIPCSSAQGIRFQLLGSALESPLDRSLRRTNSEKFPVFSLQIRERPQRRVRTRLRPPPLSLPSQRRSCAARGGSAGRAWAATWGSALERALRQRPRHLLRPRDRDLDPFTSASAARSTGRIPARMCSTICGATDASGHPRSEGRERHAQVDCTNSSAYRAKSSGRSSPRKCPAPSRTTWGWPFAPGTRSWKISPQPPVQGSESP